MLSSLLILVYKLGIFNNISNLIFISVNIAAAVLGHLSMVALREKIDGMVDVSSAAN